MTRPIPRTIALTTCLVMGIFAAQALASDYDKINSLARKIHSKSKILLKETKHYRSTPNYAPMVRRVAELDQLACHVRDIAKNEGDLDRLAHDIAEMDAKFHHVEYLFDTTELCASTYSRGFIKSRTAHVKRLLDSIEDAIHHLGDDIEHLRATTSLLTKPAVVAHPYNRNAAGPIVARVETYRVPNSTGFHGSPKKSVYSTPYGAANHRAYRASPPHRGHHGRDGHYTQRSSGYERGKGAGFSIGGGSSRITFRF